MMYNGIFVLFRQYYCNKYIINIIIHQLLRMCSPVLLIAYKLVLTSGIFSVVDWIALWLRSAATTRR